jgi:hypothetical protein
VNHKIGESPEQAIERLWLRGSERAQRWEVFRTSTFDEISG